MPSVIENSRVKEKCQIFTPTQIVNMMLDSAGYKNNVFGKRVLENSCGDGKILSIIVERYIEDAKRNHIKESVIKEGLEQDITAFDIDADLVLACKNKLTEIALKYKIENVNWNVKCEDYLTTDISMRFEYIIGNPPYIAYPDLPQEVQLYIRDNFETCKKGKFDYSYAFIEKSYSMLTNSGRLIYIVPSNIFKNVFAEKLRELIIGDLVSIFDFPNDQIFENALVSPAIIKIEKNSNINEIEYSESTGESFDSQVICKNSFLSKWFFKQQKLSEGKKLGDYFKVSSAIATLCNEAFVLKKGEPMEDFYCIGDYKIEMSLLKKAASPKNKKYKKYDEYIIFPYYFSQDGHLCRYEEKEMYIKFPYAMKYLESFKEKLKERDADQSAKWFEYGRSQALHNMNKQMMLISSIISECTEAYLLEDGEIPYSGLYIISTDEIPFSDLIDKLNSKAFKAYASNVGVCVSGSSKRITPSDIENYIF